MDSVCTNGPVKTVNCYQEDSLSVVSDMYGN